MNNTSLLYRLRFITMFFLLCVGLIVIPENSTANVDRVIIRWHICDFWSGGCSISSYSNWYNGYITGYGTRNCKIYQRDMWWETGNSGTYEFDVTRVVGSWNINCSVRQNDPTPPTCTTTLSTNNWTNKDVSVTAKCSDTGWSGCTGNPKKQTITENGKTVTFTVTDYAGNTGTCTSLPAKIDRVAPTCSSTLDTMEWSRFPVMSSVVCSDTGGSGCRADSYVKTIKIEKNGEKGKFTVTDNAGNSGTCTVEPKEGCGLWTPENPSWKTTGPQKFDLSVEDTNGNTTNYSCNVDNNNETCDIEVPDETGGTTTCTSPISRIDNTPPSCTSSLNPSGWSNTNVTASAVCLDADSGCTKNPSDVTLIKNGDTTNFAIRDNAGNTNQCVSPAAQIDTEAPTCVATYDSSNIPIIASAVCSDTGGSGCAATPPTQNVAVGQTATFTVTDTAGNTGTCTSPAASMDNIPPTCTTTLSTNNWTNKDVSVSAKCSDPGGSGCTGNPKKQTITENGKTVTFTVTDKAGNTGTCTSFPAKIDRIVPTCSSTLNNMGWSKGPVISSVVCSDTGGSGCSPDSYVKTITIYSHKGKGKFTVKDNAGNTGVCESPPAKIDTTPPGGEASIQ